MTGRARRPARRLVIDWALVEQRRVAAGLTHLQLADRVGAGAVTGPARLWTDNDHDTVALGVLERLCQVLDLHPTELFRSPSRSARQRSPQRPDQHLDQRAGATSCPSDRAVVVAALATLTAPPGRAGATVSSAGIAAALGWTLDRFSDALAASDKQLADAGLRVDHDPGSTYPWPVRGLRAHDQALTQAQRTALHQLHGPDPELDTEIARALHAITHACGTITERHQSVDPAAIVALQQRGLIRRHPGGNYLELVEDVRFGLDSEPGTRPL